MTNEQFKQKLISIYRSVHLFITIVLFFLLMYEYCTIRDISNARVYLFESPFFNIELVQTLEDDKIN